MPPRSPEAPEREGVKPPRGIVRSDFTRNGKTFHTYKIDGYKAQGVTTLLNGGLPKPQLVGWAARTVAEYVAEHREDVRMMLDGWDSQRIVDDLKGAHERQRDAAAGRGTEVHKLADALMHGQDVIVPPELAGYVESCVRFLDEWRVEPLVTEVVVASRQWRYCGTLDFVGRLPDGTIVLGDYKTSRSGIFGDVALQLAAYAHAEVYLDRDGEERSIASLGIDKALGVSLLPDRYRVHELAIGEDVWKAFLHVAWVARNVTRDTTSAWRSEPLDVPLWDELGAA
jgi:hypothetical protein